MNTKLTIIGIFAVIVLFLSFSGVTQVNTGFRGVKTSFGKIVTDQPLVEGLYFYSPFTTQIVEMDIRTQKRSGHTESYSKDAQTVSLSYSVNYALNSDAVLKTYQTIGTDWEEKIVPQIVEAKLKEIVGHYIAIDIISSRDKVKALMFDDLKSALSVNGITLSNLELQNLDFSDAFEMATEAKVVAIQNADQAKNKTVQITEESKQKIITAQADSESMRIKSQALSQNQALVQYNAVEKWNGELPKLVVIGQGSGQMLNIPQDFLK